MASGNGISGLLNFKIFLGTRPPGPPRDWRLRRTSGLPPRTQISSYGHDDTMIIIMAMAIVIMLVGSMMATFTVVRELTIGS